MSLTKLSPVLTRGAMVSGGARDRAVDTVGRARDVVDGARAALSSARVLGQALAVELVYLQMHLREARGRTARRAQPLVPSSTDPSSQNA